MEFNQQRATVRGNLLAPAPQWWKVAGIYISFVVLFGLLSPIYYLNRWDFVSQKKRNPFYSSKLVRLQERFPFLYEVSMFAQNFPMWDGLYKILPCLSGDVLQVGCGTGLFNHYLRRTRRNAKIRIFNLDANLNALQYGLRRGRYTSCIHGFIDKYTSLMDESFDAIVFARSFHHVRNHKKAFMECSRLLRDDGVLIIFDPVMLHALAAASSSAGYMANSSIDGVIWRFTRETFVKHLEDSIPPTLTIRTLEYVRQLHVSNYNLFVQQTDVVAILTKRSQRGAQ